MNDYDGDSTESIEPAEVDDEFSRCGRNQIDLFLRHSAEQCDNDNLAHSECIRWIHDELAIKCGGAYNCMETTRYYHWAAYSSYKGMSNR